MKKLLIIGILALAGCDGDCLPNSLHTGTVLSVRTEPHQWCSRGGCDNGYISVMRVLRDDDKTVCVVRDNYKMEFREGDKVRGPLP